MPNPRYMSSQGIPSVELLRKLNMANSVFYGNLDWFCNKWGFLEKEFVDIQGVYLIGSHAQLNGWKDETSDLDLKLLVPDAIPQNLHQYKREVLDRLLCQGPKKRWVDLFFAQREDQIMDPRFDVTFYWNELCQKRD
jgi:hypothetical protein